MSSNAPPFFRKLTSLKSLFRIGLSGFQRKKRRSSLPSSLILLTENLLDLDYRRYNAPKDPFRSDFGLDSFADPGCYTGYS